MEDAGAAAATRGRGRRLEKVTKRPGGWEGGRTPAHGGAPCVPAPVGHGCPALPGSLCPWQMWTRSRRLVLEAGGGQRGKLQDSGPARQRRGGSCPGTHPGHGPASRELPATTGVC